MEITLGQTDEVLREAKAKAQEIGVAVNIALLDTGGISNHFNGWMMPL
jgi:uncharacterized protein GlcG (DUF336 family)